MTPPPSTRILSLFTLAAVGSVLAGCGADQQSEPEPTGSPEPALDGGEEALEDTEDNDDDADSAEEEEEEEAEPAEGFEEIAERLEELPGDVEALVVEDGEQLLRIGEGEPTPIASVVKMYVLYALVDAIDDGDVAWDDSLTLTDELRSLPSGTLQDQYTGYSTSVHDVAERMIAISDNTGTDMLIDLLGRDAVEQAVADAGHHDPALLEPFMTTRELFQLRWGVPELGEDWAELDESERREVLEEVAEEPLSIGYQETSRHDIDYAVDWYATTDDVVAVHRQLTERSAEHEELEDVLTENPGLIDEVDDEWWETVSFKGGGLPGVVTGTWEAVAEDGTHRNVVIMLRTDDTEDIADHREELFSLALDALIAGTDTEREEELEAAETPTG